jgi:hypothetical protein
MGASKSASETFAGGKGASGFWAAASPVAKINEHQKTTKYSGFTPQWMATCPPFVKSG